MPLLVSLTSQTRPLYSALNWTEVGRKIWGEPLGWHKFFGHSFRFHKGILVSPSRRRGLGKGTAFLTRRIISAQLSPRLLASLKSAIRVTKVAIFHLFGRE